MKLRLLLLTAALLCVCAPAPAHAQSPENFGFEGGLMFWKPSPEIVLTSGTLGTPIDFVNTFAVEKKRIPDYRVVLKGGKHKIRFSSENIKYDATATLSQAIVFRGQSYVVGVPTTAELDWRLTRIGYEYDPVASPRGFIGVFFDLKYNKINAQLSAPGVTQDVFEQNVTVPTLGGIARGYLSQNFSVTMELTGLKLNRSDDVAKYVDFDLYGTANAGRNLGIQYGYRSLKVDYDIDADAGDLKLKGPYIGFLVRF